MEKLLTRREPGVHELGPLRHRAGASSVHQAEAIDCRLDLAGGGDGAPLIVVGTKAVLVMSELNLQLIKL